MAAFDDLVTDPRFRVADVRRHMDAGGGKPYRGAVVLLTSGSTAEPGVYLHDRAAWIAILASIARSREWAGATIQPWRRIRSASVTTEHEWSISSRLAVSLRSWWVPLLSIDATDRRADIVQRLNAWQPEMLVVYASMGRVLAAEKLAGRLTISPRLAFTTAEVLTPETRAAMTRAFGNAPFNRYSTTETGDLAAECREGRRMHLYEDAALVEVVDEDNRAVPAGEWGSRVLVTPFHGRLQPLIRYEISDQLRLSDEPCPCGRPFRVVDEIRGRVEEVFDLPAAGGGPGERTEVHGFVLEMAIDDQPLSAFQLVQQGDALTIRLEGYRGELDDQALAARVGAALDVHGARATSIAIEHVDALPRGPGGKAARSRQAS
jgi:phenylacetate-coenzyme A ligase PaaK-like adenylate-forming protein